MLSSNFIVLVGASGYNMVCFVDIRMEQKATFLYNFLATIFDKLTNVLFGRETN